MTEPHNILSADHESGQQARVICTCGEKFTGVLPGVAYEAWLAHRNEALEAVES